MNLYLLILFFVCCSFNTYSQNSDYEKAIIKINRMKNNISDSTSLLDFTDYDLNTIPEEVYELTNLKGLILDNTNIENIPKDIKRLKSLTLLSLNNTKIKEFPKALFKLKNLTILSLNFTEVRSIPKGINKMKNLRELGIMFNLPIEYISPEIKKHQKIKVLYVCYEYTNEAIMEVINTLKQNGVYTANGC